MDKILVGNNSALANKYGPNVAAVHNAIAQLIAADATRGIETIYLAVDDNSCMSPFGVPLVGASSDETGNKVAVDAIWNQLQPDYMVLVGAPDIIPHQSLINLAHEDSSCDDPDELVPSDLPYCSSHPYSRDIFNFIGPTRVVTRLPDIMGRSDVQSFVRTLETVQRYQERNASDYVRYLGVSSRDLSASTSKSLNAVFFSSDGLKEVDPDNFQWSFDLLGARTHFFNCHGSPSNFQYVGINAIAHDATYVNGHINDGTIMSAECCYGAQLFDPGARSPGIANIYMSNGAYAFWGSTTKSYGSINSPDKADLICQFFLKSILQGQSIGHAALAARLQYIRCVGTRTPIDFKTLAQFIILGDASIHCITPNGPDNQLIMNGTLFSSTAPESVRYRRQERRRVLAREGMLQNLYSSYENRRYETPEQTLTQLREIANQFKIVSPAVRSYRVLPSEKPGDPRALIEEDGTEILSVHLIFECGTQDILNRRMVLEILENKNGLVEVKQLYMK